MRVCYYQLSTCLPCTATNYGHSFSIKVNRIVPKGSVDNGAIKSAELFGVARHTQRPKSSKTTQSTGEKRCLALIRYLHNIEVHSSSICGAIFTYG